MKRARPTVLVLLLSSLIAAFPGCFGSSQPSASDGERVIRNKIEREAQGRIKLLSFQKTNGQSMEAFGVSSYSLEWEGEIEFLEDCFWGPFELGSWSGDFVTVAGKPNGPGVFLPPYYDKKEVHKGDRRRLSGTLNFEKTERGWRGRDGQLY